MGIDRNPKPFICSIYNKTLRRYHGITTSKKSRLVLVELVIANLHGQTYFTGAWSFVPVLLAKILITQTPGQTSRSNSQIGVLYQISVDRGSGISVFISQTERVLRQPSL